MASKDISKIQRYPADFVAPNPAVDYLEMKFIRRDYEATSVQYKEEKEYGDILINIPQKVTEAMSQNYANAQLGELGRFLGNRGGQFQAGTDSVRRLFENFGLNKAVELSNKLGASGLSAAGLLSASSGVVFNPNLEVLYEGPDFRRFNFRFNLFTKSKEDAESIYNIVEILRRASLPTSGDGHSGTSLQNVFYDASQTAAVEGLANTAGSLINGGIENALKPKPDPTAKNPNNTSPGWKGNVFNAAGALLSNAGDAAALSAAGASTQSGLLFNGIKNQRFITQPPFILLTYKRGGKDHPFLQPLLPAAINQIDFDFTPTGNYTTVGDFDVDPSKPRATTVGVTITMQLTEVTNLFGDKLFQDRAPGVL